MPLTCSVGLTRKVGQPDYGSLGASYAVEFELDSTLLQTDLYVRCHRRRREMIIAHQCCPHFGAKLHLDILRYLCILLKQHW